MKLWNKEVYDIFCFKGIFPYPKSNCIQWLPLNHSMKYEFLNFVKIYSLQPPVSLLASSILLL